jgi:hypothetical protein
MASASVNGGKIVGTRFVIIDLPEPGAPIIRMFGFFFLSTRASAGNEKNRAHLTLALSRRVCVASVVTKAHRNIFVLKHSSLDKPLLSTIRSDLVRERRSQPPTFQGMTPIRNYLVGGSFEHL